MLEDYESDVQICAENICSNIKNSINYNDEKNSMTKIKMFGRNATPQLFNFPNIGSYYI